jgi:hypothetical protein
MDRLRLPGFRPVLDLIAVSLIVMQQPAPRGSGQGRELRAEGRSFVR